ncbi:MAG TPA: nucleoside triphosphate pyrophosphohydrolase [Clostridiales bacterium]|nr:nucleoside triphosphate pyrophosphohydrolase [Clostridiales bacterium]
MKYPELYVKGESATAAINRLDRIIKLLRSDGGCPWDREQTHESLRICLSEESCEVIEAINNHDWDNLEEELGDVLLQVIFHAQLGGNGRKFNLQSIANRSADKMISRHPHVFSNIEAESIDRAIEKWENVKRNEKDGSWTDTLKRVPKTLPALRRSFKIQAKAATVGFDWDRTSQAFEKVREETSELQEAYRDGSPDRKLEEIGDLLFAVVNVARFLKVDPEEALNFTSNKFIRRFAFIEESVQKRGGKLEELDIADMDELWEEAKRLEKELGTEAK